jgi:hypothetical protein
LKSEHYKKDQSLYLCSTDGHTIKLYADKQLLDKVRVRVRVMVMVRVWVRVRVMVRVRVRIRIRVHQKGGPRGEFVPWLILFGPSICQSKINKLCIQTP